VANVDEQMILTNRFFNQIIIPVIIKMLLTNEFLSISYKNSSTLSDLIVSPMQRSSMIEEIIKNFKVIVPKCVAKPIDF
jgi:hypothetical protein